MDIALATLLSALAGLSMNRNGQAAAVICRVVVIWSTGLKGGRDTRAPSLFKGISEMVLFFRLIARLFVLASAYLLACVSAMVVLVISILGWHTNFGGLPSGNPAEETFTLFFSGAFGLITFFKITLSAAAPTTIAALVTEAFAWRSINIHIAAGGVVALFLLLSTGVYGTEAPPQQDLVITLAAGFVAGAVYWLIAGRSAGSWRSAA